MFIKSQRVLAVVVAAVLLASVFGIAPLGNIPRAEAMTICVKALDARDLGGGTLWNRNYVVETTDSNLAKYDVGGWVNSGYAQIYYNGQRMSLSYHGKFNVNGRLQHRWGVSTAWAYANSGWLIDSRWQLKIPCSPYLA